MTHASLFSGIGGAELAASWMGWENIFHCEINPFGRRVLDYWFPKSKSYEDITKTDFREWRGKIDILTGGFPCQPFSAAGKRKGDADDRYLWPEMLRAISEIRPTWVVGENVAGITSMVESGENIKLENEINLFEESIFFRKEQEFTIERICSDFEDEGYSVQPIVIPACAVGAPHRRDRVWFIAHNTGVGSDRRGTESNRENKNPKVWTDIYGRIKGPGDKWTVTNTGLQRPKKSEEQSMGFEQLCKSKPITNTTSEQSERMQFEQSKTSKSKPGKLRGNNSEKHFERADWNNFPTQSPICCRNDGLSGRLDGITFPRWRAESIKAYGNAMVPQVIYEIFKAIENTNGK